MNRFHADRKNVRKTLSPMERNGEMASRNGLSHISVPTDIDENEIFLGYRQRAIEEKPLKCYTDEVGAATAVVSTTQFKDNTTVF